MPRLLIRLKIGAYHAARVLFLRWPAYGFDDLAAVQDCLDGHAFRNAARKLAQHPEGQRLLSERPELGIHTVDWRALSLLPIDTLGYNLWHHFYSNGILKEVRLGPPRVHWGAQAEFAKSRYRATHDIRHVMLGLGVEGYEEVVLQSFQCAQLYQHLSALIVVIGGLKHMLLDGRWRQVLTLAPRAWWVGRRARFLLHMPAEALWDAPLEQVRRSYGVTPVGPLYPVAQRHPDAGRVFDVAA